MSLFIIDHLYFVVEKKLLEKLIFLYSDLPFVEHRKTKIKGYSWEGLYFYPKKGCYIEFILPGDVRKNKDIGLFFRSFSDQKLRPYLLKTYSDIPWELNERFFEDGTKWYENTQYKCDKNLFLRNFDYTEFGLKRRLKLNKEKGAIIEQLKTITVEVPEETFSNIENNFRWTPFKIQRKKNVVTVMLGQSIGCDPVQIDFILSCDEYQKINIGLSVNLKLINDKAKEKISNFPVDNEQLNISVVNKNV